MSVENFKLWCDKVSSLPFVKCRQGSGTLHYKCIVPHPTLDAGYPADKKHNGDFDEYIDAIAEYPNFDVVLVDGRWRVAFALRTLDYIKYDTVVFIHDMNPNRKYYKAVLKWYDVTGRAASLVSMRRKKNRPRPTKEEFKKYQNQPKW